MIDVDYYVNVQMLMIDIDQDCAESITDLPIISVTGIDGDYYEEYKSGGLH